MKYFRIAALIAALSPFALAQTQVTPTISQDGQVTVTVPDSSGGTHVVTFPVTAITTLNVSAGTDTYTAPASITSVHVSCLLTVETGKTVPCAATVQGTGNYSSAVSWSASAGTISSDGLFTAPASAGLVAITATSLKDSTESDTATVMVQTPAPVAPVIPDSAIAVDLINPATAWKPCVHDAGTPGDATCANNYPVTGLMVGSARTFAMTYSGAGGVRWANSLAKDAAATNFVYDTQVIAPDWTHVAALELDTNQVKSNGSTAILGTQCSSYSKTWEITLINASTGHWHWVPTNVACNPLTWTPNVVHHVRIFGTIDATGVSTYTGVELDGTYNAFTGKTGQTEEALGWAVGSVLINLQIDGLGASGSANVSANKLTIYRW